MAKIVGLLQSGQGLEVGSDVAVAAAEALQVDGLSVSLTTKGDQSELIWCSGDAARSFEDTQYIVGEGPGPDAVRTGAMVWVPDLGKVRVERWPALSLEVSNLQIRAVYCFPLTTGAIRVGVLTAVRRAPGWMSAQQAEDALVLAAALTLRYLKGEPPAAPGPAVTEGADTSSEPALQPEYLPQIQNGVVHQATGMISVQLLLPVSKALLLLRAHAYGSGRPLNDVAQDIVDRRLRLTPIHAGSPPTAPPAADED
ncbi:GAF and ANTAR domain-containing protein [Streptomyces sp. NPDC006733]|uniref:GAF and ANTAR domain-containing protein n=1 Tax=Streptomyces sp. NPDC006733 TaxID=3155460 RepID=UPI0033E81B1A